MASPSSLVAPGAFTWALGIEDTFIPQLARGGRVLDEYVLTQHDRFWREDLRRIADVGVRHLRYGIPWYRVNPAPGEFDWSWTDEVLAYLVQDLGIAPILDLVHYGAPLWLQDTFLAPDYPARVAEYASAVARRYGSLIRAWTPLNEPRVHAHYGGWSGIWPPYRRGVRGHTAVLVALGEGIAATIDAIRAEVADAEIVHVEAVATIDGTGEAAVAAADHRRALDLLAADLAQGSVVPGHRLYDWLVEQGVDGERLARLAAARRRIDVWGVNWYPQMSDYRMTSEDGPVVVRRRRGTGAGLERAVREIHARTQRPVMVTETSVRGRVPARLRWLEETERAVARMRADGVPLVGVTWFPAFSLVSWDYRRGRRPLEAYLAHYGLWDLRPDEAGVLQRVTTPVAPAYDALARRDG